MPAPPRRGDAPAAPNDGGCIEGRLDAGEGGEWCRTGAHGGRPDLRSAAGPADGWAGHRNRLSSPERRRASGTSTTSSA